MCKTYRNINQEPSSTKTSQHWDQGRLTQRFQKFVDDWAYPDKYEADLYPLNEINQVPVTLMIGAEDTLCMAYHAYYTAEQIQSLCNVVTVDSGHVFPAFSQYNKFMVAELTNDCQGYR